MRTKQTIDTGQIYIWKKRKIKRLEQKWRDETGMDESQEVDERG